MKCKREFVKMEIKLFTLDDSQTGCFCVECLKGVLPAYFRTHHGMCPKCFWDRFNVVKGKVVSRD